MTRTFRHLMASAAILSAVVIGGSAYAQVRTSETVFSQSVNAETGQIVQTQDTVTHEVVQTEIRKEIKEEVKVPENTRVLSFKDLDADKDGVLSRDEVGMRLFKLYDTDGNQVIDNLEYKRKAIITVQPIERETKISYFVNGANVPAKTEVSQEDFLRETMLAHFDANKDGLSPKEFLQRDFLRCDVNRDKVIDAKEWLGAYNQAVDKRNKEAAAYNR